MKIKKISLLMLILLCIFISGLFAMPPHPDLLDKYKKSGNLSQLAQQLNAMKTLGIDAPVRTFPKTGNRKVLVILIAYSDTSMNAVSTPAFYSNLFNGGGSTTLTWKKYYQDMSNNQLNLSFDIVGPFTAINTLNYYGQNNSSGNDMSPATLVGEAIDKAKLSGVNFSQYDNDNDGKVDAVVVIHAGRGEESGATANTIWSHRWNLDSAQANGDGTGHRTYDGKIINDYCIQPEYIMASGDTTIGVFCREFGHILGLPDLYDINYATDGVGRWSLMAAGSWNGPSNNGSVPAPLLAWERNMLGWLNVQQVALNEDTKKESNIKFATLNFFGIFIFIGLMITLFIGRKKGIKAIILPVLLTFIIPPLIFINVTCLSPLSKINNDDGGTNYSQQSSISISSSSISSSSSSSSSSSLSSSSSSSSSINAAELTFGSWSSSSIAANGIAWYYFNATNGTKYSINWDDAHQGTTNYNCDIKVTAYRQDGTTPYFATIDSGFSTPQIITASSTEKIYIKVQGYNTSSTGTFAVKAGQIITYSLEDIEVNNTAIKIPIAYSYSGYGQYYLVENKEVVAGTWTEYLPGSGLLVTLIDDYIINGIPLTTPIGTLQINMVNSLTETGPVGWCHGVTIMEADGNNELWTSGSPYGENGDTFKNVVSNYPNRNDYTAATSGGKLIYSSCIPLLNVSAAGSTMTFETSK